MIPRVIDVERFGLVSDFTQPMARRPGASLLSVIAENGSWAFKSSGMTEWKSIHNVIRTGLIKKTTIDDPHLLSVPLKS